MATGSLVISKRASATAVLLILLAMAGIAVAGKVITGTSIGSSSNSCEVTYYNVTITSNPKPLPGDPIKFSSYWNVKSGTQVCDLLEVCLYINSSKKTCQTLTGSELGVKGWANFTINAPDPGNYEWYLNGTTNSGDSNRTQKSWFTIYNTEAPSPTPKLTFVSPTPSNGNVTSNNWIFVNTTLENPNCYNNKTQNTYLYWNGSTRYLMNRSGSYNWYKNVSNLSTGTYPYYVSVDCCYDESCETYTRYSTELRTITISAAPTCTINYDNIGVNNSNPKVGDTVKFFAHWTSSGCDLTRYFTYAIQIWSDTWNRRDVEFIKDNWSNHSYTFTQAGTYHWNITAYAYNSEGTQFSNTTPTKNITVLSAPPTPTNIPPQYHEYGVNNTTPKPGDVVKFYAHWTDDKGLSMAGLMVYTTSPNFPVWPVDVINLSGKDNWSNFTYTIPDTEGKYTFYITAQDTENVTNQTPNITITIVKPPSCSGIPQLSLLPNPAGIGERVTADITGLSYCQGRNVTLVLGTNCSKNVVNKTVIDSNGTSAVLTFTAPSSKWDYNYTACIDINGDGVYSNDEYSTDTLSVIECIRREPIVFAYPEDQKNDAGEKAYYVFNVTNKDSCPSMFNVSANCSDCEGWAFTIKPSSKEYIRAGETKSFLLEVKNTSGNVGETFEIEIVANDAVKDGKSNSTTVTFSPTYCERSSLPISIEPSEIATAGPKNGSAVLSFENPSSDCTTVFNISTQCPKDWSCTLPTPFWLWAGQSGNLTLSISPKASADAGNYTINISAKVKNIDNYTTNQTSLLFRIVNCTDADKDGFYAEGEPCGPLDCNDQDPDINPNATVYCFSTIDANCDNVTDKNDPKCINRNQSIWQNFKNYTIGDGKCESTLGENEINSPSDCKPAQTGKCGDNKRNSGEDCDGTDDSACPGLCTSTCKCPFMVGDGVCDTEAGETAAISPVDCKAKGLPILPLAIIAILAGVGGALAFVFLKRKSALSDIMAAHGVESYSPGANPTPAMETALAQGFSPSEVASQFREAGWPEEHVKGALSDIAETQEQLAGLAEQHGVNVPIAERRQAERYVKKCLDMGFTPAQIKTALISADWPEGVVNDILAKYTSEHVRSHAKESGVLKPTEDIEKLRAYVKEELDEGHTPEQIREELLKAGWDESAIDEVLP